MIVPNEDRERVFQDSTLCGHIKLVNNSMESQDKVERVPVGHVGCEDLLGFVSALLEEVNQLLKHDDSTERDLHKGGG